MKPNLLNFAAMRRALRRYRRPIIAMALTAAFIKCFPLFIIGVLAIVVVKIAKQKPPAEFETWR